jgi:hypothetical protein
MSKRKPVTKVIPGACIHPLEKGVEFTEALMFIKSVDKDKTPAWSMRTTQPLNLNEILGVLTVYRDILKRDLADNWEF